MTENPNRPVFLVTHPRSRSTAFERMFFDSPDFTSVLEIFQYPFYYGPERLGLRFLNDEEGRKKAGEGFEDATFKWAIAETFGAQRNGARAFVKDMAKMIMPQDGSRAEIATSLASLEQNGDEAAIVSLPNPTVLPLSVLRQFHFTFLIRNPRASIPSLYRLTQPPMSYKTHWHGFQAVDAGYAELRRLFEFLVSVGVVGPGVAAENKYEMKKNGNLDRTTPICVIDSDALLHDPERIMSIYCNEVGYNFHPEMLRWDGEESRDKALGHYLVDQGFHDQVLSSTGLGPPTKELPESLDECEELWRKEFGDKGATLVRKCVEENIEHYEFLKGFCAQ